MLSTLVWRIVLIQRMDVRCESKHPQTKQYGEANGTTPRVLAIR